MGATTHGFRRGLALIALAALAACGGNETKLVDGASCYPAAARPWISAASSTSTAVGDPGGPLTIYLDGSASMVGYIRGGAAGEKPLADLVGLLPSVNGIDHSEVQVLRFDRKITELRPDDVKRMQTEAGYLCPSSNRNCDAQESHIDQALDRIATAPADSLSVVVSDLWLANSDMLTTDGVALGKPLDAIFASGRSIAVYGFDSPYAGRVSDLPSGNAAVTAKRRYLFLVVAGPVARLRAFHQAMKTASSERIMRGLGEGKAHYSLFTLDPLSAAADGTQGFGLQRNSPLSKANFLPVQSGVKVPQYRLDRASALRATDPDAIPGAQWQGVADTRILPGAVWQGASQGTTQVFRRSGDGCLPDGAAWRPEGTLTGGWPSDGGARFTLQPAELASLPTGTYLLVGNVRRTTLETPNPATQWMRDWSFDAASEPAAVKRPVMPTLNLAETARLLETALLRSAEARPMKIGGFAVAVEIQ